MPAARGSPLHRLGPKAFPDNAQPSLDWQQAPLLRTDLPQNGTISSCSVQEQEYRRAKQDKEQQGVQPRHAPN